MVMKEGKRLQIWATERGLNEQISDRNGLVSNIVEELGEWLEAWKNGDEHGKIDSLADIVVFAKVEMIKLGYSPDKVLKETIKEISSREGEWSTKDNKWRKYETIEAKAKWYKASYKNCGL
jgi:phosphoribosyl-ATP pyrophosphohydrolase